MELIHVIRGVDAVRRSERAEHLGRLLEVDYVDDLVAIKTELAAAYLHHDRVPFAVVRVPQYRSFKVVLEGIVSRGAVRVQTHI